MRGKCRSSSSAMLSNALRSTSMRGLLLGLGLRSFSMHPAQILAVKQEVLRADTRKLASWAQQVLTAEDPSALLGA